MKNKAFLFFATLLSLSLQGCLPDSPEEARAQAEQATQTTKEALTAFGEKAESGVASSRATLEKAGATAQSTTDAVRDGLTALGESVGNRQGANNGEAVRYEKKPLVFEREQAGNK